MSDNAPYYNELMATASEIESLKAEVVRLQGNIIACETTSEIRAIKLREAADFLLPRLEQQLRDREVETVERCIEFLNEARKPYSGAAPETLRALSPDPEWLPNLIKKERLEARRDTVVLLFLHWHMAGRKDGIDKCAKCGRDLRHIVHYRKNDSRLQATAHELLADLDRQLKELGKGK